MIFSATTLSAQLPGYHVQLFDERYGFSSYAPLQIIKDKQDFIWVLYADRVQRFDGRQLKEFRIEGRLLSLLCDRENRIWLSSFHHTYLFESDHRGFKQMPLDSSGGLMIGHFFQLPGKPVWLHTSQGFYEVDSVSCRLSKIDWPALQPKSPLNHRIFSSYQQTIFFCDADSVFAFDINTRQKRSLAGKNNYNHYAVNDHLLLLSTFDQFSYWYDFDKKEITPVILDQRAGSRTFFVITALQEINNGQHLLLCTNGIYQLDAGKRSFNKIFLYYKGKPLNIAHTYIDTYFDSQQNVWIVDESGLITFKPNVETISLVRSQPDDSALSWSHSIRGFAPDEKDNIWLATEKGFVYWDTHKNEFTNYLAREGATDQLNHPSIRGIHYDGKYVILGPTNGGLWLYDPRIEKYCKPLYEKGAAGDSTRQSLENDFIRQVKKLHDGTYLIIAVGNVYHMDDNSYLVRTLSYPGSNKNNSFVYQDEQHQVWIGTAKNLYCLDSQLVYKFHVPSDIGLLQTMCEWRAGEYLVGGLTGMVSLSLQPGSPEVKRIAGFDKTGIASLIKDQQGKIWIATLNNYLHRFDPVDHTIETFDQADNLQGNAYNQNSFYQAPGGRLFLGGIHGINYFYPDRLPPKNETLQISITKIMVNRDDTGYMDRKEPIRLKHSQHSIELTYIAPYYKNPLQVQYRYRLEGIDTGWQQNGNNNSIRFTSLPPGHYTFRVAASINKTDWFELDQPVSFIIHPPFWKTWWFLTVLLVIIMLLSFLLFKRRVRYIRDREIQKTELQKIKASSYQAQLEIEQVINYFAASISGKSTVEDLLWDVAKNCISKLGFEDCVIYLKDEERKMLVQKAAWGAKTTDENKIIDAIEIPVGKGIVGAVAASGRAEIIADTSADNRYIQDDAFRFSEISVPILDGEKTIGVIDSEHPQRNFYTPRHLQILTTIASLCADKIDKIKAEQLTRKKEVEVLKLNKDLAISKLTALRAQMNPHFIFNALNSVQQYILQGNVIEANKYLSRFSKLQREILNHCDENFISLEKEIEMLDLYLQLEQLRFKELFTYSIRLDDAIDASEIKIPPMMMQPFVENAIWHGLMPKQDRRRLDIKFTLSADDILLCTIQDNGIGREAAMRLRQAVTQHKSKGLSLVYERLDILRQQYQQPFDITITDLADGQGNPLGTLVTITIFVGH